MNRSDAPRLQHHQRDVIVNLPHVILYKAEVVAVELLKPGGSLPIPQFLSGPNVTLEVLGKPFD